MPRSARRRCLARTQVDYARALGPGPRATELLAAAAQTAAELGLGAVARKVAELGGSYAAPGDVSIAGGLAGRGTP